MVGSFARLSSRPEIAETEAEGEDEGVQSAASWLVGWTALIRWQVALMKAQDVGLSLLQNECLLHP